jgi:uncharacterized membrane-anchored protein YhcB (DUF1043 family)
VEAWVAFIVGVVIGAVVLLVTLGLCQASGRAELEMEIMELENVLADLRAELTRQKGQVA